MNSKKQSPNVKIDKEALYFQALQMAYNTFVEEEKKGYASTELRLQAAIEAARILYRPFN